MFTRIYASKYRASLIKEALMDAEAQAYVDALHTHWEQVGATIQDLPAAALNWRPLEQDTSSAAVIVTHMCGLASLVV